MSKTTIFIFRILLVLGGILLIYIIGKPLTETINYRITGIHTEGRVIGFRGRGSSTTVFEENTGKSGKKSRSRRPVYRYQAIEGSLDSMDGYSKSTILLPWLNFELNDRVNVVFPKDDPARSHIFSLGIIATDLVLLLLCLFMIKLGIKKSN